MRLPQVKSNAFYLQGGEKIKIGRVIMKVVDINVEQLNQNADVEDPDSDNNTQMSLGDIDIGEIEENKQAEPPIGPGRGVTVREGITLAQMIPSKKQDIDDDNEDDGVDDGAFDEPGSAENPPEKEEDNQSKHSQQAQCRICYSDDTSDENPLLTPCKCSGSMRNVHLDCLRQWLSRHENRRVTQHVTTYTWRAVHCELCKTRYEDTHTVNRRKYQLLQIDKPQKNFIVLESFQMNGNQQQNLQQD